MSESLARIQEWASSHQEDIVGFLRDLIAIPSTSTREEAVIKRIAEEMRKVGFDEVRIDAIGNVIGRIGNGPVKILYDSHIDTVGIADPTAWEFDPFQGKYENGIVWGRGASDNKAAMATMVYAGKAIKELGLEGDYTLYMVGVVEEESMDGWAVGEMIKTQGVRPDFVVLGECTNLDIYRGHRGRCEIKVTTKGVSCHASAPDRGVNAIYKMQKIIKGIEELGPKLLDDPFLGKGTIAVTMIECKTGSLNVVPDECTIYIDRRMTWGETAEKSIAEIRAIPGAEDAIIELLTYEDPSWTGYKKVVPKDFPTWVIPEDHILVQTGVEAATLVRGSKPEISRWVFSTDGIAITGQLGIPTIGFGPSEEKWAHTVKDQVSVDHLLKATTFYALFPQILARRVAKV